MEQLVLPSDITVPSFRINVPFDKTLSWKIVGSDASPVVKVMNLGTAGMSWLVVDKNNAEIASGVIVQDQGYKTLNLSFMRDTGAHNYVVYDKSTNEGVVNISVPGSVSSVSRDRCSFSIAATGEVRFLGYGNAGEGANNSRNSPELNLQELLSGIEPKWIVDFLKNDSFSSRILEKQGLIGAEMIPFHISATREARAGKAYLVLEYDWSPISADSSYGRQVKTQVSQEGFHLMTIGASPNCDLELPENLGFAAQEAVVILNQGKVWWAELQAEA